MTAPVEAPEIRVVVADDSPDLRLLLRLALDDTDGISVVGEAADGAEALALVDAIRPDAVLLDVAMPIMDGLDALKEITRRYGGAVPVVMWSAFSARHVAERAAQLGAFAYIEKSGDLTPVVTALREAVAASGDRTEAPARAAAPAEEAMQAPPPSAPAPALAPAPQAPAPPPTAARPSRSPHGVLLAAALFAAVFAWREADPDLGSGIGFLYVAPIAVLATQFGLRAGIAGAAFATFLWTTFALDVGADVVDYGTRVVGFVVVGGTAGWHSDRARRIEKQRARDAAALVAANRRLAEAMQVAAAANTDLGTSNQDLRQFMHVASHDLAEPLRTMGGFAKLLATRYEAQLDPTGREYLSHVVQGAARMQRLLDDLRTYTMASQQGLTPERVDLGRVLEGVRTVLGASIQERGAVVTVEGSLPAVDGDSSMLGLVFQNLVSNALKFNTSATPTVTVRAAVQAGKVVVDVSDNGIGLPAGQAERVFELFQRLHGRETYPGTGLGLAICRRIVERHGGTIELAGSSPRGSTFRLTLPAAVPAQGQR